LSASSVINPGLGAGTSVIHSTNVSRGAVPVGSIGSVINTSCVTLIELPQESVTLYVYVIVSGHGLPSVACDTNATVGVPQLSASSITTSGSGNGAGPPGTIVCAGLVAVGKVTSLMMISCDTVI